MASIRPTEKVSGKKAAIIGGGPTGIAAAYFLARAGIETTIFERESCLGGVPRHVILLPHRQRDHREATSP